MPGDDPIASFRQRRLSGLIPGLGGQVYDKPTSRPLASNAVYKTRSAVFRDALSANEVVASGWRTSLRMSRLPGLFVFVEPYPIVRRVRWLCPLDQQVHEYPSHFRSLLGCEFPRANDAR